MMNRDRSPGSDARKVVVVGGGIAGVESALTLALGCPDADVTLVSQWPSLRILPNLVYVPLGMSPSRIDTPLEVALDAVGARLHIGVAERIDRSTQTVICDNAVIAYDVLIACPGTIPAPVDGFPLRSLDDALRLRAALEALPATPHPSIVLRQLHDDAWTAPLYELAMLLRAWLIAIGREHVNVTVATSDSSPFLLFGSVTCSDLVNAALDELGIEVIRSIPHGRIEGISGDVNIDFGPMHARPIPGLGFVDPDGYYRVRADGSIADRHFVVGDAAHLPFKAAFATSWQARRVVQAIGGDLSLCGAEIDGVPITHCEYQMDMVHRTLVARIPCSSHLDHLSADTRADVHTRIDPPDKLQGTLIKQYLHPDRYQMHAPRRFHDWLGMHDMSMSRVRA